ADGQEILTVEGIYQDGKLRRVQDAFVRHNAIQCGFCIPGLVMSATALLQEHPNPTRTEIKTAIAGNLCRCTGYQQIIEAIEDAAGQGVQDAEPGI
ncbi:MAG: 2Fe-2S iron-sulfur cluster-binding protein, partial [Clostridiales bacterium]|nr:2Fe-2S iron-sulfur cluster-binding protein [Clostridiales bacterium]